MTKRLPTYYVFGRRTLANRFFVLLTEINNVHTKSDVDAIHDMRVASRRFHAAAKIFTDCINTRVLLECERHVRALRKSAGAVRDCDVQQQFVKQLLKPSTPPKYLPGLQRVIVRLSQKREKQFKKITTVLVEFEKHHIENKMRRAFVQQTRRQLASRTLKACASSAIQLRISSLLSYEQYAYQTTAAAELHQMRIAAKRLRYVLEIFNPVYRNRLKPFIRITRSLQDSLGAMHDCDVWLQNIPAFLEKERIRTAKFFGETSHFSKIEKGVLYLMEHARMQRTQRYQSFALLWRKCGTKQTWKQLSVLVAAATSKK